MSLMAAPSALRRDPLVWICSGLFALLASIYLTPLLGPTALENLGWYGNDPIFLSLLLLAIQLGLGRSTAAGERLFWSYVTAAFASWLIAAVYTALVPLLGFSDRILSQVLSDCLYLGYYLALLLATEVDPEGPTPQWTRDPDRRLNAWGGVLFAFALLAYFVLIPSRLNPAEYGTFRPSMLLYVGLEVLLSLRFAHLVYRARSEKWRWIFSLLLTVSLLSLALLGLEYWALFPSSPVPDNYGTPWDLLWCLPFLPALLAARLQHRLATVPSTTAATTPETAKSSGPLVFYALAFPLLHNLLIGSGDDDPATRRARHTLVIVFSPFFTTRRGGIGLGLALVTRILTQHHWRHTIESRPGLGTKFKISAPLVSALGSDLAQA